jgi:hypothetical protein
MSDSKDDNKGYDVGYGKPPTTTQFKKGQSGNLKGRPKGSKSLSTILNKELNALVTVTKQGKKVKVKKKELIIAQLANQAASGNLKAVGMVISEDKQLQDAVAAVTPTLMLKPTDELVQDACLTRLKESLRAEIAQEQLTQASKTHNSTGESS